MKTKQLWSVTDEESATTPGATVTVLFRGTERECKTFLSTQDARKIERGGFGLNSPQRD